MVKSIHGKVHIKRENSILSLKLGSTLKRGDIIMTKVKSGVGITFSDGSRLTLGENSIFCLMIFLGLRIGGILGIGFLS